MTALRSNWTRWVLSGAVPLGVSAAWIPLRDHLPNADLALLLVLLIATVGWIAGARPSVASAMTAAVAFDVLDTRPYGTLSMSRGSDVTTALILLATGAFVGAGAARLNRYRRSEDQRSDALAVVMEASGLVATGEQRELIAEALGSELVRSLELAACEFHSGPPDGKSPVVARDGGLVGLVSRAGHEPSTRIDLPIWCQGEIVAHYGLVLGSRKPSQDELRVALSLADQAGAAMTKTGFDPPPRPRHPRRLRLLPSSGPSDVEQRGAVDAPAGQSERSGEEWVLEDRVYISPEA